MSNFFHLPVLEIGKVTQDKEYWKVFLLLIIWSNGHNGSQQSSIIDGILIGQLLENLFLPCASNKAAADQTGEITQPDHMFVILCLESK